VIPGLSRPEFKVRKASLNRWPGSSSPVPSCDAKWLIFIDNIDDGAIVLERRRGQLTSKTTVEVKSKSAHQRDAAFCVGVRNVAPSLARFSDAHFLNISTKSICAGSERFILEN
jgi:hypothetical protein